MTNLSERNPRPTVEVPARWLGWLMGFATGLALIVIGMALVLVRQSGRCGL